MNNRINFLPPWVETNMQPAFYDKESGSCLQQTARMYAKVNQLVRIANEQWETIQDYINQFIELKDFVEDYFDNLDVQNEINAKLDKMMADGSLSEVIGSYVDTQVTPAISLIDAKVDAQNQTIDGLRTEIQAANSGSPLVASSTAGMTDTSKVYVNTSDGKWYYYNGATWTIGGTYQGTAVTDNSVDVASLDLDVKDATGITKPSVSFTEGYYYGYKNPDTADLTSDSRFKYSAPFFVKAGKTVAVECKSHSGAGASSVSIIATCESDGTNIRPKINDNGSGVVTVFKWEVPSDSYIVISCRKEDFGGVYVYDTKVEQDDLKGNGVIDKGHYNLLINTTPTVSESGNVTYTVSQTGDETYPVEYHVNYDYEVGSGQYAWAYYLMLSRSITATTCSSITVAVDVKSSTSSHLSCFLRINNTTLTPRPQSFTMYDIGSNYKRYVYTFTFSETSVSNVRIVLGERDNFQDTLGDIEADFYVRYAGFVIGNNKTWLLNNPFTLEDKKTQLDITNDVEGLFSSFITFGSIGDSLASGESVANNGGVNQFIDNNDFSWGQFIAREHGMTCNNYNKGGLTTRSWLTNSQGLPKLLQNGSDNRAFIIGLGVNDANTLGSGYIGEASDIKSDFTQNEDTFYGNYGRIIGYCKRVQPKCKIFMYTIARVGSQYDSYNTAIREIATLFDNVYLIDVNRSDYNTGFINNNLRSGHFNAIGYKAIADLMYKQISNYMLVHYQDFKQIEFIGTDYSWN